MKKKSIILILVVIVVIVAIIGAWFLFGNKQEVKIDLNTVAASIQDNSVFSEIATMDIDKTLAADIFNIPEENMLNVVGKLPMMNVHASMYVVIEAQPGKADEVKAKLEEYGNLYEEQWSRYLPDQYDLVKERKMGKVDSYVYMVVAEEAEAIENLIVPSK